MIEVDFKIENEERVESVFNVENDDDMNFSAEMGGGVSEHDKLKNRDLPNQHPISAITGLETALKGKQSVIPDLEEIRKGAEKGENALPSTTKYGSSLSLTINEQTYVLTAQLKDQDGKNLGTAKTVDLPLETMVVGAEYDEDTKEVVLTLKNGQTVRFSIADLVSGLQTTLTAGDGIEIMDNTVRTNNIIWRNW